MTLSLLLLKCYLNIQISTASLNFLQSSHQHIFQLLRRDSALSRSGLWEMQSKQRRLCRLINKVSHGDNLSTFTFARRRVNGGRKKGKPRILSVQNEAIDPASWSPSSLMKDVNEAENLRDKNVLRKFRFRSTSTSNEK